MRLPQRAKSSVPPPWPPKQRQSRMRSVRDAYDVPAYRGREVVLLMFGYARRGRIISSTGSHLYVQTTEGRRVGPLHPCWRIDYLDGRGDRTDQPTPMDRAWT